MSQKNIYKALFISLFLLFPLGQFANINAPVFGICLFWLIFSKNKSKNALVKPFLIFFIISLISLLPRFFDLERTQFVVSSLYLIRLAVYASLVFVVHDLINKKIIDKNFILNGLILSGIALSVIGLLQYLIFPDMRMMKYLGWDDHYYRIISTFFDPNFTGVIYACTSLLVLRKNKFLFLIPFAALLLTYSRTAYLSFFAGLSLLLIQKKQINLIFPLVLSFLLLAMLLPRSPGGEGVKLERTSSINNRLDSIKTGFEVFLNNPVIGIGFNTYKFLPGKNIESHSSGGVENSYVLILATTGILGFLAFLNILRRLSKSPEILAILISALFINSLFYPWVMIYLFLLMASTLP